MNRLTKKVSKIEAMLDYGSEYIPSENCHSEFELYYKLGKIEDLEEQLGCPLEIVFNLLNKEIVIFDKYKGIVLDIRKDGDVICIHYFNRTLGYDEIEPLSNYGKTFWIDEVEE